MTHRAKIIALSNHKGGCGKTTTTVNLAAELARLKLRVLVVDLDPQANVSMHISANHLESLKFTVRHLLLKEIGDETPERALNQAILTQTKIDGVHLLPSEIDLVVDEDKIKDRSPARPMEVLGQILEPVMSSYDVIIIDTSPRLGLLTGNALACATHYIIPVMSGSPYSLYGINNLQKYINEVRYINPNLQLLGVLLLRHDKRTGVCKLTKDIAEKTVGRVIPMEISSTNNVDKAAITGQSIREIDASHKVARQFRNLAIWTAKEIGYDIKETIDED